MYKVLMILFLFFSCSEAILVQYDKCYPFWNCRFEEGERMAVYYSTDGNWQFEKWFNRPDTLRGIGGVFHGKQILCAIYKGDNGNFNFTFFDHSRLSVDGYPLIDFPAIREEK